MLDASGSVPLGANQPFDRAGCKSRPSNLSVARSVHIKCSRCEDRVLISSHLDDDIPLADDSGLLHFIRDIPLRGAPVGLVDHHPGSLKPSQVPPVRVSVVIAIPH